MHNITIVHPLSPFGRARLRLRHSHAGCYPRGAAQMGHGSAVCVKMSKKCKKISLSLAYVKKK